MVGSTPGRRRVSPSNRRPRSELSEPGQRAGPGRVVRTSRLVDRVGSFADHACRSLVICCPARPRALRSAWRSRGVRSAGRAATKALRKRAGTIVMVKQRLRQGRPSPAERTSTTTSRAPGRRPRTPRPESRSFGRTLTVSPTRSCSAGTSRGARPSRSPPGHAQPNSDRDLHARRRHPWTDATLVAAAATAALPAVGRLVRCA